MFHNEVETKKIRPQGGSAAGNQYGVSQVRVTTNKQAAFIKSLIDQKNTDGVVLPDADLIPTLNRLASSDLIGVLLGLPDKPGQAKSTDPTEKQVYWINKLLKEKAGAEEVFAEIINGNTHATRKLASQLLDIMFKLQDKPKEEAEPLEQAMYSLNGQPIKVYWNKSRTCLLAKELVLHEGEKGTWDYMGAASRFVKASDKMTKEEAVAFGHEFGICCVCGATLSDPISVQAGIGPVCAEKF